MTYDSDKLRTQMHYEQRYQPGGVIRTPDLATSTTDTLVRVAEVLPPGYYGHGPLAGRPVHLLRLGMCNLACDWCETPHTVAALGAHLDTTAPYTTVRALTEQLRDQLATDPGIPLLISGGEPLLQTDAILDLTQHLNSPVWVETNGTLPPPGWWTSYVHRSIVSPKVGTHDPQHRRLTSAHAQWADYARHGEATFDFTCATLSDVLLAAQTCTWLNLSPSTCWITPRAQAVTGGDHWLGQHSSLEAVYDTALEHGFRLAPRPLRSTR